MNKHEIQGISGEQIEPGMIMVQKPDGKWYKADVTPKKGYYDDLIAWCNDRCTKASMMRYDDKPDECVDRNGDLLGTNGSCKGCPYATMWFDYGRHTQ